MENFWEKFETKNSLQKNESTESNEALNKPFTLSEQTQILNNFIKNRYWNAYSIQIPDGVKCLCFSISKLGKYMGDVGELYVTQSSNKTFDMENKNITNKLDTFFSKKWVTPNKKHTIDTYVKQFEWNKKFPGRWLDNWPTKETREFLDKLSNKANKALDKFWINITKVSETHITYKINDKSYTYEKYSGKITSTPTAHAKDLLKKVLQIWTSTQKIYYDDDWKKWQVATPFISTLLPEGDREVFTLFATVTEKDAKRLEKKKYSAEQKSDRISSKLFISPKGIHDDERNEDAFFSWLIEETSSSQVEKIQKNF